MSMLGKIFGTESVINKGFDLVDDAFHTKQEQSEDAIRATGAKINILKAYEAFKITQRFLAMLYGIPYVIAWFATLACSFFMNVDQQFALLTQSDISMINLIVIGFYFGGGMLEGAITKYAGAKKIGGKK